MDKLDFKKFSEKFNNIPIKVAEELSEIDRARDVFVKENYKTIKLEPEVTENIQGRMA